MISKVFLTVILIIHSLSISAIEGEIVPKVSSSIELEEGGTFEGIIRLWPVAENIETKIFDNIKLGKINDNFYLVEKSIAQRSLYNSEVVEIYGIFALIKAVKNNQKVSITINENKYSIELRRINTIATAPAPKNFEYAEQFSTKTSHEKLGQSVVAIPIFLAIAIFLLALYKSKSKKNLMKKKRERILKNMREAKNRLSLEQLPKDLEIINIDSNIQEIKSYIIFLNKIQYKKNWSDEELGKMIALKNEVLNVII